MVDFSNRTVVCIGSGPSLTEEDCKFVSHFNHGVIAVNNSWQRARFADVVYAGDYEWWRLNKDSIDISAELWTCSHSANSSFGINLHRIRGVEWNSGLRAIEFAEACGATRIILLGYDCSVNKGLHWHGPHAKSSNPTANRCANWRRQFRLLATRTNVEIINCSRETTLTCFPQANLEEVLCLKHFRAEPHRKMSLN